MIRVSPPDASRIRQRRRQDWEAALKILLGQETSLPVLLKSYVDGVGAQADHVVREVRKKIDQVAISQGVMPSTLSVFDEYARIRPEYMMFFLPTDADAFLEVGPTERISSTQVFPDSANPHLDLTLPKPINMGLHRATRPGFHIRRLLGSDISLYVTPFGYQTFSQQDDCFWPSASSRTLSRRAIVGPELPTPDHVVIVQDRFGGDNFAHFLFDWVTRLGLFLESGVEDVKKCLFVMGGICGPFQQLLIDELAKIYHVDDTQFLFPEGPMILRPQAKLYWFSDQIDAYAHPAQLAHERSVAILRRVAAGLPVVPANHKRLYISRSDAERRRVTNEAELWPMLADRGFEMVRMADHSIEHQLALVRGAEIIVGSHGMGLTHVSLHSGSPLLVELHNPEHGTDAYALMAKAMRFPYRFILGDVIDNGRDDFRVSPAEIEAILGRGPVERPAPEERAARRNLLPGSATFSGTWHALAQGEPAAASTDVPGFLSGNVVIRHVRRDPTRRLDANVGTWWDIPIEASRIYTASCWIWIPYDFVGEEVALCLGEWGGQSRMLGDLTRRDQWQRVTASVTSPEEVQRCNVVLRVQAVDGAALYSTCWQLEAGPTATEYQATP